MRSQIPVSASGSASLAKPGSIPLTHSDAPPAAAASRTTADIEGSTTPSGNCRNTGPLETTSMPARKKRARSAIASSRRLSAIAVWTMQSGFSASRASASVVARTPSSRPSPARSPASRPALASDETQTPTSSSSGWASMPAMLCRPTLPVLHCTTR